MQVMRLDDDTFDWRTGAGGADAVRRIAEAAEAYDGREALNEAARLSLRHDGLGTGMLFLAEGAAGTDGGFAYVHGLSGPTRPEVELVVAPGDRGQGLGTALARTVVDVLGGIPVTAWSHGNHPAAAALAARLGFDAVRELRVMRRAAGDLAPPAVPDGYAIRSFRPGDEPGLLEVNGAAFAAHPEQGALDLAGLRQRFAEPWFDPAGLLLAERAGRVVGFHWTKVHPATAAGPMHGEVYVIGVHPSTQGSGLGQALLVAGLRHLQEQGVDEVVLYVEGDNARAIRLYESYGFTHDPRDTDVLYAGA